MIDIKPTTPFGKALPLRIGATTIKAKPVKPMWSVSPFVGRENDCIATLRIDGIAWPKVGRKTKNAMWFGLDQVMVFADRLPPMPAAVTDQSDAWATVTISGNARDVLARLVPADLTLSKGAVLRSLAGHMTAHVTCVSDDTFDVMVMRSMARTLVHDLTQAAQAVAARGPAQGDI